MSGAIIVGVCTVLGCSGSEGVASGVQTAHPAGGRQGLGFAGYDLAKPKAGGDTASRVESDSREARDARNVIRAALGRIAKLRGLEPKREVEGRWVSRAELLEIVDRSMADSMPAAVMEANEAMLVGFGVVGVDFDLARSVRALMGSELAGLYEPRDRSMYLAQDLSEAAMGATLTHELVHALQDQHFNLESRLEWAADRGDQLSALHALAEGDATLAMMAELQPEAPGVASALELAVRLQLEASTAESGVPGILVRSAAAAYSDGVVFVEALKGRGGWASVDAAWRSPPVSTEQILHVEKYISREAPELVPVPSPPSARFGSPVYQDVMGEQGLRLLLEEWVPRPTAVSAARDWAGDRVAVYLMGSEYAIVWRVRYDSLGAADRGGVALARGVLATETGPSGLPTTGVEEARRAWHAAWVCRERQGTGPIGVKGQGREVLVLIGPFERRGEELVARSTCGEARGWAGAVFGGAPLVRR